MIKQGLLFTLALVIFTSVFAQVPAPGKAQSEPIAIMNATAHLGNGEVIENSIVTFENGKITQVADATASKVDLTGYKQIDAKGKHVYPGLILALSKLGLVEINAVRATRDYAETGNIKPHVRTAIAYNTDSEVIPTMKFNGIQIVQVAPVGGLIEGTSSVMQLDAWNWEDALYREDDGIHINWPSISYGPRWWLGETARRANKDYEKQTEELVDLIADTKSYMESMPASKNLILEAMIPVLKGEKSAYMYANGAQEIIDGVQTLREAGIKKVVVVGAKDVWAAKDLLKEFDIPVLLDNIHRRPYRTDEDVDWPYRLAGELDKAGILVGLTSSSGDVSSSRNLPFYAGTVAAYGVDPEVALKMITSNTAKILEIDTKTGTLEEGKDANIVISTGDLLDMRTNNVEYSFIQGREVNLEAHQQRLYQKFKEKYEDQMK
ncbi:MAG: amidohydrolase family protein [Cyclobacteriaceae bacterium]